MHTITDNIFTLVALGMGGTFLLTASFILIYYRNQQRILRQRQQFQQAQLQHQKDLMKGIIASQETEQKRIGQDLHDGVGTALSALKMTIGLLDGNRLGTPPDLIRNCNGMIDRIIRDVRTISHNLSPPGLVLYGFTGALEELGEQISRTGQLQVLITDKTGKWLDHWEENNTIILYRVIKELLNNTIKHAGASQVFIDFTMEDTLLRISYRDDGIGMPEDGPLKKGMGLRNIESRLGVLQADYSTGTGAGPGFSMRINIQTKK